MVSFESLIGHENQVRLTEAFVEKLCHFKPIKWFQPFYWLEVVNAVRVPVECR